MKRKVAIRIMSLFMLLVLAACSGAGSEGGSSSGKGNISINVKMGKSLPMTKIKEYKVVVSGEGISTPIEKIFPAEATEGVISSIPAGDDRKVEVFAVDISGRTIRRGENFADISGGENTVDVELKGVPLFANILDNSVIERNRLKMNVISDPLDKVVIKDSLDNIQMDIVNPSTNEASFLLSADKGDLSYTPSAMPAGLHTLLVKSLITGYSSEVKVRVVNDKLQPATTSGGGAQGSGVH